MAARSRGFQTCLTATATNLPGPWFGELAEAVQGTWQAMAAAEAGTRREGDGSRHGRPRRGTSSGGAAARLLNILDFQHLRFTSFNIIDLFFQYFSNLLFNISDLLVLTFLIYCFNISDLRFQHLMCILLLTDC